MKMRVCVINPPAGSLVGKTALPALVQVLPCVLLLQEGMTSACVPFV